MPDDRTDQTQEPSLFTLMRAGTQLWLQLPPKQQVNALCVSKEAFAEGPERVARIIGCTPAHAALMCAVTAKVEALLDAHDLHDQQLEDENEVEILPKDYDEYTDGPLG